MEPFAHPLVQSVFLPAAVAGVLLVLGRVTPLPGVVTCAASLGVLACLLAAMGAVPWPPRSGLQKLGWVLALASVMGPLLAVQAVSARPRSGAMLHGVFVVAALVWLAWPRLASPSAVELLFFTAGVAGALVLTARPGGAAAGAACEAAMLGVGALCLAAVSLAASSLILAQLCGALGVVSGLLFVRAMWDARQTLKGTWHGTLVLTSSWGRVCLALLAALVVLLTRTPGWSLALLLPVFFAHVPVAARVPSRWRPLAVAAAALVPGLLMIALALWLGGSGAPADDAYYRG